MQRATLQSNSSVIDWRQHLKWNVFKWRVFKHKWDILINILINKLHLFVIYGKNGSSKQYLCNMLVSMLSDHNIHNPVNVISDPNTMFAACPGNQTVCLATRYHGNDFPSKQQVVWNFGKWIETCFSLRAVTLGEPWPWFMFDRFMLAALLLTIHAAPQTVVSEWAYASEKGGVSHSHIDARATIRGVAVDELSRCIRALFLRKSV